MRWRRYGSRAGWVRWVCISAFESLRATTISSASALPFLGLLSLVFTAAFGYLLYRNKRPIVFDLQSSLFYVGWKPPEHGARDASDAVTSLSEVYALQLISHASSGDSNYTAYELNLVLRDKRRVHVLCHGDAKRLREDARTLAGRLGKPLWDGIKGEDG